METRDEVRRLREIFHWRKYELTSKKHNLEVGRDDPTVPEIWVLIN